MKLQLFILLLLIQHPLFANENTCSFIPENDMSIPVGSKTGGLSEEDYNGIIDRIEKVYTPIVEQYGGKLQLNRLWESPVVNAGTYEKDELWVVNLYGGYARHPAITPDGYALVICHEIGHHIGGAPKKAGTPWSSTEGQADYFATLKCLRKVFSSDDNASLMAEVKIPPVVEEKCSESFKTAEERALCMRTTMAGLAPGNISADIRGSTPPSLLTTDPAVVTSVFEGHPAPQCRLDTYFQGSICEVSSFQSVSQTDETVGTCHSKNGQTTGLRPSCWFIEGP